MALGATLYTFEITLNDADRGVYERLEFRLARHPSETAEYLLTRMLAYCLEYAEGLTVSKGLSDPELPALLIRDLTGVLKVWIEVGLPEPARLHKAAKAAARVVVYPHKDVGALLARIQAAAVHRAEALEIRAIDPELIAALVVRLERRMNFDLTVSDRQLYLSLGADSLSGAVTLHPLIK